MIKMTLEEYESIPPSNRGVWTTERTDIQGWEELRVHYMGKRTMREGASLLVEDTNFQIVDNSVH